MPFGGSRDDPTGIVKLLADLTQLNLLRNLGRKKSQALHTA